MISALLQTDMAFMSAKSPDHVHAYEKCQLFHSRLAAMGTRTELFKSEAGSGLDGDGEYCIMFDMFTPNCLYSVYMANLPVTWLTAPVTWLTTPVMCHLLGTFVIGQIHLLNLPFVPRLVVGQQVLSVAIVFIHGWVAGCQHFISPSSNNLNNDMLRQIGYSS